MKALTVPQPWASLIATGAKRIETRSWSTRHRGSLAIHAGGVLDEELLLALCPQLEFAAGLAGALPPFRPGERPLVEALPYGAIVAIADLRDVRPTEGFGEELDRPRWLGPDHTGVAFTERAFGDFRARRFGWVLGGVRPLPEPIVARGRQGLWEWTPPASFDLGALPLRGAARASRPPEPQYNDLDEGAARDAETYFMTEEGYGGL